MAARPRFHLHFTPTSSSWLNLVERWFAELTNRKLHRSTHHSVTELEADVQAWIHAWNEDPKPFVWTKTADQILDSLAHYCRKLTALNNDSGHWQRYVARQNRIINSRVGAPWYRLRGRIRFIAPVASGSHTTRA